MLSLYPWQKSNWEQVEKFFQKNRLPHALLLEGPKGLGKFNFAQILAKKLLCLHTPSPLAGEGRGEGENYSCGNCRSCHLFETYHPDLFLLEPEEKSTNIKIDAVRNMIEKIQQTSTCGRDQVVIISPAEAMNTNCANALLKTLEEPPENVVFLLVSHQAARLAATVQSRCQRLTFLPPAEKMALAWLKTQSGEHHLEALLRISDFAPLRALELAENQFISIRDRLIESLNHIQRQEESPVEKAGEWQKQDPELFFLAFLVILLDLLRLQLNIDETLLLNSDCLQALTELSQRYSREKLNHQLEEVQKARVLLLSNQNPNAALLIERVLLC